MSQFTYQYKQAWASLRKKPGFIATVVTTMGMTLGALLCIFTLAYFLLFRPLPYPDQDRLYKVESVFQNEQGDEMAEAFTYPGLMHLYNNQDMFDIGALAYFGEDVLTSLPNQPALHTSYVSPEWLVMLDAKVHLGRVFEQTEAINQEQPVAILSYQTWRDEFEQDANIIGKKIEFSGTSFRIVGVLSEDFVEPALYNTGRLTHVWLPWDFNLETNMRNNWGSISDALTFAGKLKTGITEPQAVQKLTSAINDTWQQNVAGVAFFSGWSIKPELLSFKQVILGNSETTVYLLIAGVIGLVLIATANIANLFVSRTAEQRRKLAIFAALGAKKSKLFSINFAEASLLMGLSIALALIVSEFGFYVLQQYLTSELPRVNELSINGFTLSMAVVIAFFFAFVFARLTTRMINYRGLNSILQSSGKGTGVQVSKKTRQFLIVSQVAIATVLIFVNISLFKQAFDKITEIRDYQITNMVELSLSLSAREFPPREEVTAVMTELRTELAQLPQVESVSLNSSIFDIYPLRAITSAKDEQRITPRSKRIDETYFDSIGQQLIEGDNFTHSDIVDRNRVFIVNDVLAKQLNPEGSALGMKIRVGEDIYLTVKGVVKGIKLAGHDSIPMRMFSPVPLSTTSFTINLVDGQNITREQVVSVLSKVTSLYSVFSLETLTEVETSRFFTEYVTAITTAVLALITLFLAGIGLYGILSYGTQMRRFELGTRMAIGAKRKDLVSLIVKDNSRVIVIGIFASLGLLSTGYFTYSELFLTYLSSDMIPMFILTLLVISGLSLFACYWPLRQYINQPAVHSLKGSD